MAVVGLLCVYSAVVAKLVGDKRPCYWGFLVTLLFIDWARVVELAPNEIFDKLLLLFYIVDELAVVVLKN